MLACAAASISASLSLNGTFSRVANARPTAVLPAPGMPTITTLRVNVPIAAPVGKDPRIDKIAPVAWHNTACGIQEHKGGGKRRPPPVAAKRPAGAEAARRGGPAMVRILKILIGLAVLVALGLLAYSYTGLMDPAPREISVPVILDVD